MDNLQALAAKVAPLLIAKKQTIAVVESTSGGLISAALLSVPGASAYFVGGAVTYTGKAREALLGIPNSALTGLRPISEPYESIVARRARTHFGVDLCLIEHGAAGPAGNRYGDPPGRCCIVLATVGAERATMIETGSADRFANMQAFAAAALTFLVDYLEA